MIRLRIFALLVVAVMCLAAAWPALGQPTPIKISVEIAGVRSTKGQVLVALHTDRWDFPTRWDKAVARAALPAAFGSVTALLEVPAAGRYALIVVHDEDRDGRMTKNAFGLPREGYATGRNATSLEFPYFESALVDLAAGTGVTLRLLYP